MGLDGFCFLFGLIIIPFTFQFFPKLFFDKKLVITFFIFALTLAAVSLTAFENTNSAKPNFYLFLLCPIFSLTLLRLGLYIFNKQLNRNPKNPTRNWFMQEDGLGWDRFFYFTFMTLSLILPVALLAYFYG